MTYQIATHFAQTWGLVFMVIAFAIAAAYALWPANRPTFDKAAQAPLTEDEPNG
jgi:cytochrome c oxidase cbb3-type subunit IV